jgi:hypothetical protein
MCFAVFVIETSMSAMLRYVVGVILTISNGMMVGFTKVIVAENVIRMISITNIIYIVAPLILQEVVIEYYQSILVKAIIVGSVVKN